MRNPMIDRRVLVERIAKNRDAHKEEYEKALQGFQRRMADWFDEQKKQAVEGKEFATFFNEPQPQDHTMDYDAVLDMIEVSGEGPVELTPQEFRQFMRDEWGWSKEAATSNSLYAGYAGK